MPWLVNFWDFHTILPTIDRTRNGVRLKFSLFKTTTIVLMVLNSAVQSIPMDRMHFFQVSTFLDPALVLASVDPPVTEKEQSKQLSRKNQV